MTSWKEAELEEAVRHQGYYIMKRVSYYRTYVVVYKSPVYPLFRRWVGTVCRMASGTNTWAEVLTSKSASDVEISNVKCMETYLMSNLTQAFSLTEYVKSVI